MYCPQCGTKNGEQARFCSKCGASLAGTPVEVDAVESTQTLESTPVTKNIPVAEETPREDDTTVGDAARTQQVVPVHPNGHGKSKKTPIFLAVLAVALVGIILFGGRCSDATKSKPAVKKESTAASATGSEAESEPSSSSLADADSQSEPETSTESKPAVDLGATNLGVAADEEYYYMGIGSNYKENGVPAKARIVRIRKDDEHKCEILWEGAQDADAGTLRRVGDTLFFASSPWRGDISINSMKTDGSNANVIVGSDKVGKNYSNQVFACSDDCIFYGAAFENGWQVRSCGLDGSNDKLLCEGKSSGSPVDLDIVSLFGNKVYFSLLDSVSNSEASTTLYRVSVDGGAYTDVLHVQGTYSPQVVGDRVYVAEGGDFVSYSLDGKDRKTVASFSSIINKGSSYIWNMSTRYAFVLGHAGSYDDGGVWRIDLQTGDVAKVGGPEQYASINIVDDVLLVSFITDSYERWNLDLQKQSELWPNTNATKLKDEKTDSRHETTDSSVIPNYLGVYSVDFGNGASYGVMVMEQDGAKISFAIERMGRNYSPIYDAGMIHSEVIDGATDFTWSDSWSNSGTGHIEFEDDQLTLSMIQTQTAEWNRSTLSTENTGSIVLPRISNEPPEAINPQPNK